MPRPLPKQKPTAMSKRGENAPREYIRRPVHSAKLLDRNLLNTREHPMSLDLDSARLPSSHLLAEHRGWRYSENFGSISDDIGPPAARRFAA